MMLATMTLTLAALGAVPTPALARPGDAIVTWEAPTRLVRGKAFPVSLRIEAPADGTQIATWVLTPGAFTVGGKALAERKGDQVFPLAAGSVVTLELDLSGAIQGAPGFDGEDFELGFAKEYLGTETIAVRVFEPAPEDVDFLTIPVEELSDYQVIMDTNQGSMVFELYPDKAPKHVRNFLELCHSGFYVGTLFHRVSPQFMIQGGCSNTKTPNTRLWGQGQGPRRLDAEFTDTKHERGILSMARSPDVNSASAQFFVMTARTPSLDGQYSVFGKLVAGDETLTSISNAPGEVSPRDGTTRPSQPQEILATTVIWSGKAD